MKESVETALEAIAFLLCGDDESRGSLNATAPAVFDGFEPISGEDSMVDDEGVHIADTAIDQPVWPLRASWAARFDDASKEWPVGSWQFACVRTLRPEKYRQHVSRWFPKMVEMHWFTTEPAGRSLSVVTLGGLTAKGVINCGNVGWGGIHQTSSMEMAMHPSMWGARAQSEMRKEEDFAVRMAAGMALRRRYYWSVLIAEGNSPRARLPTDPVGVREIFALRDVPPGRARRLALLHWVRQHRRQRRSDPTAMAWVRAHLRGAQDFDWNGLRVRIEPSQFDAEESRQPKRVAAE